MSEMTVTIQTFYYPSESIGYPKVKGNLCLLNPKATGRLQTLIDKAWSNKNFLYYLTIRLLQHTSSEVIDYNCYKHLKIHIKEENW